MIIVQYNPNMYTRHILPLLDEALRDTPVVLLNSARQTGKSTPAQSLSADNSPAKIIALSGVAACHAR